MEVEALYSEAMADIDAGRHDEAQRLLAKLLIADPRHDRAWMALGLIVPEMDRAIECLQRSLSLNPANAEAQKYLALAQDMQRSDESTEPQGSVPALEKEETDADDFLLDEPAGRLPGLGRLLVQAGALTPEKLEAALQLQQKLAESGKSTRLGDLLVERRFVTREQLDEAVREQRVRFNDLFRD
jgi:tetratricopeptide (TPR) repeat protein